MRKWNLQRAILSFTLAVTLVLGSFTMAFATDVTVNDPLIADSKLYEEISKYIDVDYGYELAKEVSLVGTGELGFRTAGSKGEKEAAVIIEKAMKDLGLANVRKDDVPVHSWDFGKGSLKITNSKGENKTITLSSYAGSVGTSANGISGEIVYVGDGSLAGYEGKDVKDKIVLAEFDMNMDYWVTQPSYQAELNGAKAFILLYNGESYGVTKDALNSFDVISRDAIPIMNISRNDGAYLKDLINKGTVEGTLVSDAVIDKNGVSGNIVGEIPGVMKDKYIIFGAHYDGYFHAFQDDIMGVGIFMSIAKAIKDSGYQPQHTLIFTAFGSEEYGITNSHYDWIRGSWYQINNNTPELAGNSMMFLNFDTQRPDMKEHIINVVPEYRQFFEKYALTLNLPEPWVDGVKVAGTNGPWSDDYNYISSGIPGLISGKGNTQWKFESYHTNYDDYTVYNPVTYKFNMEHYLSMMLSFDQLIMAPLNFDALMEASLDTLGEDIIASAGLSSTELVKASNEWAEKSKSDYSDILKANALYARMRDAESAGVIDASDVEAYRAALLENRATGMEAFRIMEKDFTKLDTWDVVSYGHEIAQNDYASIDGAIKALEDKDPTAALESLTNTQFGWILPKFEKEVYEYWGIEAVNPERKDLYWGTGKTLAVIDLFDVYQDISKKSTASNADYSAEIKILNSKLAEAKTALSKILTSEAAQVKQAAHKTEGYTLKKAITDAEATLIASYKNLPSDLKYGDVKDTHWAFDTITGLKLEGILEDDETFDPQSPATRVDFAKWLTEAFNLPTDIPAANFSDVDKNSEDAKYIAAVNKAGIMIGNADGTFSPNSGVKRAEMVKLADNLLAFGTKEGTSSFTDVNMNKWYGPTVEAAASIGLVEGVGGGLFAPEREMTRAEAATLLETILYLK